MQVAKRTVARAGGTRHVARYYKVCCDTRGRPRLYHTEIIGSYVYFKTNDAGWQFARVVGVAEDGESKQFPHTIKMLDMGQQFNVHLSKEKLTTLGEEAGD